MSVESQTVAQIQVDNVVDYAQYIAHVANLQLGESLPDGTTITLIDPSALENVHVLHNGQIIDSNGLEIQSAIHMQNAVSIEHVILEQPILDQLSGLQSAVSTGGDTLTLGAIAGMTIGNIIEASVPLDIKPPVGKGPYNCSQCDKVFNKYGQLLRHLKTHDEDKPFRCLQCPASFNVEDNLKLHRATHVAEDNEPICPECGKKFSRVASLKSHIMLHEKEESLMCSECGDEFSVQSQLDRHMNEHRQEHEGSRSYGCRQCPAEYSRLADLREHMKKHYKIKASLSHRTYKRNIDRTGFSHRCHHCTKTFQKPSQLIRHERIHTGERPFVCNLCEKTFNQKGALHVHMTKHTGERSHMCQFCPATFAQKGNLRAHILRVHTLSDGVDKDRYRCEECSCTFKKLGSLNAHISRAHSVSNELPTQVEVQRTGDEDKGIGDSMIQQLLDFSEQVSTGDAGHLVASDPDVREAIQAAQIHEQASSLAASSDILQQALENSGLTEQSDSKAATGSRQRDLLTTMTMTVHDTSIAKRLVIRKVNGVRWHQCTYCSKEFKKPSDLVRHIRIHTHEKPYKCTQCFRAFAVKSTLTAHIKTHSGVKDYKCDECKKMFSTQGSLKVHLRLHTGAKPFDCQYCDKKFRTSAHRKAHVQSHLRDQSCPNPRPRRVLKRAVRSDILTDVPLQEPILITDSGLIQQMPRHTVFHQYLGEGGAIDRPYKCNWCSRAFKKSSHLKQHIRSHTGEKPFRCAVCLSSFVSSGVLKAHRRTHTGVKSFKCLVCDAAFTTNGSLKRHMSTHSDSRPFMCPYCQKTFKTSVNCKKHMKTHRHEVSMSLQEAEQEMRGDVVEEVGVVPVDNEESITTGHDGDLVQQHTTVDMMELHQGEIGASSALGQHDLQGVGLGDAFHVTSLDQAFQHTLGQQVFEQQQGFGQAFTLNGPTSFSQLHSQQLSEQLPNSIRLASSPLTTPLPTSLNTTTLPAAATALAAGVGQHQTDLASVATTASSQFTFQSHQLGLSGVTGSLSGVTGSMGTTSSLVTPGTEAGSMQNILQRGDVEQTGLEEVDTDDMPEVETVVPEYGCPFKCHLCDKGFTKDVLLQNHLQAHSAEVKGYRCSKCTSNFHTAASLRLHLKTHNIRREFICDICQAVLTTKLALTRHMAQHKTPLRPYRSQNCPYCQQLFRTAQSLKKHICQVHSVVMDRQGGENEENLAPHRQVEDIHVLQSAADGNSVINKNSVLDVAESLTVSQRILIESSSERDRISEMKSTQAVEEHYLHAHQCSHCHKSFKKPSDLQRHIRIHTGEKPFQCHICQRAFTVKSTLDSHMRTHKPSAKLFQCHICDSLFSTKGSLKVHMRLHTGAKPFRCPHCNLKFRTSGHRKSHIMSHFKQDVPRKRGLGKRHNQVEVDPGQQQQQVQPTLQQSQHPLQLSQPQQQLVMLSTAELAAAAAAGGQQLSLGGQVISLDQLQLSHLPAQVPYQLAVQDTITHDGSASVNFLQDLMQGGGLQLQLTGFPHNLTLTSLDGTPATSLLGQTLQIDAALFQQLQQQGNVNITINPVQSLIQTQQLTPPPDPALVQGYQIARTLSEVINPNIIVQQQPLVSMTTVSSTDIDHDGLMTSVTKTESLEQADNSVVSTPGDTFTTPGDTFAMTAITEDGHVVVAAPQNLVMVQQADHALEQAPEAGEDNEDDDQDDQDDDNREEMERPGALEEAAEMDEAGGEDELLGQAISGHKNFLCAYCFKQFKTSDDLNQHMQSEHEDQKLEGKRRIKPKQAMHKCTICDKTFQKPSQLERHTRIHTGERPFVCEICQKAFNQKNALNIHLKKHSGEKPHTCQYCDAAFTQRGNLKTHIKRAHHQDMVQSMKLPKTYFGLSAAEPQAAVELVPVASNASTSGEPVVMSGSVEAGLYDLHEIPDLM